MTHEPPNAESLFRELIGAIPEYAHRYDDHLEYYDELLPYVLMDDFSRFVVESQLSGDHDVFKRCIQFINECYTAGGDDVRLLVRSTFSQSVGILWRTPEQFSAIYDALVPELKQTIRTVT